VYVYVIHTWIAILMTVETPLAQVVALLRM